MSVISRANQSVVINKKNGMLSPQMQGQRSAQQWAEACWFWGYVAGVTSERRKVRKIPRETA